ncbi:DUF1573 domain-containing protein [Candidatus Uhrbacteria bacterium]|nr:DUF1573 domain-containing protein [Candidatus Uhrbacteria bacterium]
MRPFLIVIILSVVVIGAVLGSRQIFSPSRIEIEPPSVDLGDIARNGGIVSASVQVANRGKRPLEINRLSTSCGCTTAKMDQSPIAPSASRTLTITFDPMVHPDQEGPLTRVVYIQTSDPKRPEVEITVTGRVIP